MSSSFHKLFPPSLSHSFYIFLFLVFSRFSLCMSICHKHFFNFLLSINVSYYFLTVSLPIYFSLLKNIHVSINFSVLFFASFLHYMSVCFSLYLSLSSFLRLFLSWGASSSLRKKILKVRSGKKVFKKYQKN